jgi:hypothetical protein
LEYVASADQQGEFHPVIRRERIYLRRVCFRGDSEYGQP